VTWLAVSLLSAAAVLPFGPGERATFRISYAHLLAGRATLRVTPGDDPHSLRFVAEARSQGFFAWLLRYRVEDRTVALWDSATGCSRGIEKHLREGRAVRDQRVTFGGDGAAWVEDPKIRERRFPVAPCVLDVLSAFFVTRVRGVPEAGPLELPVFDNGKHYTLGIRFVGRERLDLPLGKNVATLVIEPQLVEGTGLFVKKGRLRIWLTDDARRIPVRLSSRVPIGSVTAELESYEAPEVPAAALPR
jgi:hypothetical protein